MKDNENILYGVCPSALAYDYTKTIAKFKFQDGSELEPYGYAYGEHLLFEDGCLYLLIQTTSGFVGELVDRMLKNVSDKVILDITSKDENINNIVSTFNGLTGTVKIERVGLRNTNGVPNCLIKVQLSADNK